MHILAQRIINGVVFVSKDKNKPEQCKKHHTSQTPVKFTQTEENPYKVLMKGPSIMHPSTLPQVKKTRDPLEPDSTTSACIQYVKDAHISCSDLVNCFSV